MANPAIVTCTADTWEKVATNVIKGVIHKKSSAPDAYYHTYRQTGEAAPTGLTEAVRAFLENEYEVISSSTNIDVYIYAVKTAGSVRVDA